MIAVACIDLGQRLAAFNAALDQVAPGTEGDCRHALLREGAVVRPGEASRFGAGIRRVASTQFLSLAHPNVEQAQLGDDRDREVLRSTADSRVGQVSVRTLTSRLTAYHNNTHKQYPQIHKHNTVT